MCSSCFTTEINSFPNEKTWISFDVELTKKLSQGKIKFVKTIQDERMIMGGYTIYECQSCGEKWKVNDPDNAFRGYFLKLSTSEPKR